jgi:hypothetical protein
MLNTIPRDELKQKIDRKDRFLLVETLAAATYLPFLCARAYITVHPLSLVSPRDG